MKVEHTKIAELLELFDFRVKGIIETAQCGDDGYIASIIDQQEELKTEIKTWCALNMAETFVETKPLEKYKKYQKNADKAPVDMTITEAKQLFKANLYFWFRRKLREDENIGSVIQKEISIYLQSLIEDDNKLHKELYFGTYMSSTFEVIDDIESEILEQRAKAPQLKIF